MKLSVNPNASFSQHILKAERNYPNNLSLPVLYYKQVLTLSGDDDDEVKDLFEKNGWTNAWTGGIFNYFHYHSTTHEVLAVIKGDAMLQLGGDDGNIQKIMAGDVLVLPAGVAHKNVSCSEGFLVVGAYPKGQHYNKHTGKSEEVDEAKQKIENVALPEHDPVFGDIGPLVDIWKKEGKDPVLQKDRQF